MPVDRRLRNGEFGGAPGSIQKAEDGHVELTVKEKAFVGRVFGMGGEQGQAEQPITGGEDPVTGEVWEDASHRRMAISRAERYQKTNGRGPEEA